MTTEPEVVEWGRCVWCGNLRCRTIHGHGALNRLLLEGPPTPRTSPSFTVLGVGKMPAEVWQPGKRYKLRLKLGATIRQPPTIEMLVDHGDGVFRSLL